MRFIGRILASFDLFFGNVALYMFSFVCFEQTMGNFSTFGRLSTLIVLGVFLHNSAYKILTRFFQ